MAPRHADSPEIHVRRLPPAARPVVLLLVASIQAGVVPTARGAEPGKASAIARLRERHRQLSPHVNALFLELNPIFVRAARRPATRPSRRGRRLGPQLCYVAENAVLKELNDRLFDGDKEAVDAVCGHYKMLLLAEVAKDAELGRHLLAVNELRAGTTGDKRVPESAQLAAFRPENLRRGGALYADWKQLQLVFAGDSAELRERITALHRKVATAFEKEVAPALFADRGPRGIAANPRAWFMGGLGRDPDRASAAARVARTRFDDQAPTPQIVQYEALPRAREAPPSEPAVATLTRAVREVEALRRAAERQLLPLERALARARKAREPEDLSGQRVPHLLVAAGGQRGEQMLSRELVELIRTTGRPDLEPSEAPGHGRYEARDAYLEDLARLARRAFGFGDETSEETLREAMRAAHAYASHVDTYFAPAIFVARRLPLDKSDAEHGLISVDLRGQGARNHLETQRALFQARRGGADRAIAAARAGERVATRKLGRAKEVFDVAVRASLEHGAERAAGALRFSGDDGVYVPRKPLEEPEKMALLRRLAIDHPEATAAFRVTFIPPDVSEGTPGAPAERNVVLGRRAALAETVEKTLRRRMLRAGASSDDLAGSLLGIDLEPDPNSQAFRVNVLVAGTSGEKALASLIQVAQEALNGAIGDAQAIVTGIPLQSGRVKRCDP